MRSISYPSGGIGILSTITSECGISTRAFSLTKKKWLAYIKAPTKEQGQNLPPSFGLQFFGHVAIDGATEVMTVTLKDVALQRGERADSRHCAASRVWRIESSAKLIGNAAIKGHAGGQRPTEGGRKL
jgi:hypothetical protein